CASPARRRQTLCAFRVERNDEGRASSNLTRPKLTRHSDEGARAELQSPKALWYIFHPLPSSNLKLDQGTHRNVRTLEVAHDQTQEGRFGRQARQGLHQAD